MYKIIKIVGARSIDVEDIKVVKKTNNFSKALCKAQDTFDEIDDSKKENAMVIITENDKVVYKIKI